MDLQAALKRPRPPSLMLDIGANDYFQPDFALSQWVKSAYCLEDGPLFDPTHAHLGQASIGFLWTNCENKRHMRRVVGESELGKNIGVRLGPWQRARTEFQLYEWFGDIPDFIITLDAHYADTAEDIVFCALVDHELCHCAQATDSFGQPAFDKHTGLPKYAIRGHDLEEFVSVVRRFGVEAAGENAVDFVVAAAQPPSIGQAKLSNACGVCLRLAA